MTTFEAAITVAAIAFGTLATRGIAFVLFPQHKETPKYIVYLGKVLPFAITSMLVVYCLKEVSVFSWPFALPELISIALVVGLFKIFKNSLLAIASGTILYMFLIQVIF